MRRENRKDKRVRIEIPAYYTLNKIRSNCLILDIGNNGAALKVSQILLPGDMLHLHFTIKKYGDVNAVTLVRYMKGTRVGCQFIDMTEAGRETIENFVAHNSGTIRTHRSFY